MPVQRTVGLQLGTCVGLFGRGYILQPIDFISHYDYQANIANSQMYSSQCFVAEASTIPGLPNGGTRRVPITAMLAFRKDHHD